MGKQTAGIGLWWFLIIQPSFWVVIYSCHVISQALSMYGTIWYFTPRVKQPFRKTVGDYSIGELNSGLVCVCPQAKNAYKCGDHCCCMFGCEFNAERDSCTSCSLSFIGSLSEVEVEVVWVLVWMMGGQTKIRPWCHICSLMFLLSSSK